MHDADLLHSESLPEAAKSSYLTLHMRVYHLWQELVDWHRPVIQALLEAGVDVLALESIPAQKEAEALVQLLKEFPDACAWLSLTCKVDATAYHIIVHQLYSLPAVGIRKEFI